jgi:hypothetical protein
MVTKQQAMECHTFHFGQCKRHTGPRGGVTEFVEHWRSNGQCKTWKTRPEEFSLPIKYGLWSYSYLTNTNAHQFHTKADCPLRQS